MTPRVLCSFVVAALAGILVGPAACKREPPGQCVMWQSCCEALAADVRFRPLDIVEQQCPPQTAELDGDQCYERNGAMLSAIAKRTPILREHIPGVCVGQ